MVVRHERNDLASQRQALVLQQNLFLIRVQQLEDGILQRLSEAQGDITEDRALIEELELSKKISDEISVKVQGHIYKYRTCTHMHTLAKVY
jgi:dynein heavy chain